MNEEEASLFDMLWLLLASVIFVPIFQKIPGGNRICIFISNFILGLLSFFILNVNRCSVSSILVREVALLYRILVH